MRKVLLFSVFVLTAILFLVNSGCMQKNVEYAATVERMTKSGVLDSTGENNLLHYWDDFKFQDSVTISDPNIGEQRLVDFITAFPKVSTDSSALAIKQMLSKAKAHPASFSYFTEQYKRYLYDPNSPMRNDLYYEPVLEFILDSCQLDDADRYRNQTLLDLVRKNQEGTQAVDFDFQLTEGNRRTLYDINSPLTLLFFYEPGCPSCAAAISELGSSWDVQERIDEGTLTILAIYPQGERDIWKGYQSAIPEAWMNGFDPDSQILSKRLYDLKASPTLYLLDEEKNVILKDTDMSQLRQYLVPK